MTICIGTTAKGNPCKNEAVSTSEFCGNHRPDHEVFKTEEMEEQPIEVEAWEFNTTPERAFFDEVYEHFCDDLKNELSFEKFYEIASKVKLLKEERYSSDIHGDNYAAQEGELVIVKS